MGTPAARAAPRGLAGLVDRNHPAPYELLDTSKFPPNFVLLNVYDIGDANIFQRINAVSTVGDNVLIGGIYHAGVQIYGLEWSFGFTEDEDTGVFCVPPRMATQHTYRATCPLGVSEFTQTEVTGLIEVMKDQWRGPEYHLLHRNCLDFANAFCSELGVGRIPGWVDRFGRTASSIDNFRNKVGTGVNQTRQLVGTGVNQTKHLAQTVGADMGGKLRGVGEEARQVVGGMRRDAPKIAEAAQTSAQTIGSNVKNWGKGLINAARALGEDQAPERRGNELKNSLRNRGGLQEFLAHGQLRPSEGDEFTSHEFSPPSRKTSNFTAPSDDAFLLEGLPEQERDKALGSDAAFDEALGSDAAFDEDDAKASPAEMVVAGSQAMRTATAVATAPADLAPLQAEATPPAVEAALPGDAGPAHTATGDATASGALAPVHAEATPTPAVELVSPGASGHAPAATAAATPSAASPPLQADATPPAAGAPGHTHTANAVATVSAAPAPCQPEATPSEAELMSLGAASVPRAAVQAEAALPAGDSGMLEISPEISTEAS